MKNTCRSSFIATATILSLTVGCATHDPVRQAKPDNIPDDIPGDIIAEHSSSENDYYVDTKAYTFTGAAVGSYMDEQQSELESQLALEIQDTQIEVVRVDPETLRLDIRSNTSFAADSTQINGTILTGLKTVAEIIGKYDKTVVHIIGHMDGTGEAELNQIMSLRRASSVAVVLHRHGVERPRLRSAGLGDTLPLAINDTASDRKQNRRVEVFLKGVVEGRESDAYQSPY